MIDLPSGSVGRISNNLFVQGRDKENHSALIAVAADERKNPSRGLVIEGNRASLPAGIDRQSVRSEEHTSELQSLMRISYAVFCFDKKHDVTPTTHDRKHGSQTLTPAAN